MHLNNGEKTESVTQTTNVSKLRNELQCSYPHVNHIVWRTQTICYRHYKAKKIIIWTATLECTCPRCEHKNIYEPTGSVIQSLADNSGLLNTLFGNVVLFPTSHCLFASYRSWDWQKMKHQKSHRGVGGFIVFTVWLWDTRRSKLELQIKNTRKPLIGDFFIKVTHTHTELTWVINNPG